MPTAVVARCQQRDQNIELGDGSGAAPANGATNATPHTTQALGTHRRPLSVKPSPIEQIDPVWFTGCADFSGVEP